MESGSFESIVDLHPRSEFGQRVTEYILNAPTRAEIGQHPVHEVGIFTDLNNNAEMRFPEHYLTRFVELDGAQIIYAFDAEKSDSHLFIDEFDKNGEIRSRTEFYDNAQGEVFKSYENPVGFQPTIVSTYGPDYKRKLTEEETDKLTGILADPFGNEEAFKTLILNNQKETDMMSSTKAKVDQDKAAQDRIKSTTEKIIAHFNRLDNFRYN